MSATIRFSEPMSRLQAASPNAPYSLHNARLEPYGSVRAFRTWSDSAAPPVVPSGPKPWYLWSVKPFDKTEPITLGENINADYEYQGVYVNTITTPIKAGKMRIIHKTTGVSYDIDVLYDYDESPAMNYIYFMPRTFPDYIPAGSNIEPYYEEMLDRRSGKTGTETYGVEDFAAHNGRLYAVKRRHGNPSVRVLPENYNGSNLLTEPPLVTRIYAQSTALGDEEGEGIYVGRGTTIFQGNRLSLPGHGLGGWTKVNLFGVDVTSPDFKGYYVVNPDEDTFQITDSIGGQPIPFSGDDILFDVYADKTGGMTPAQEGITYGSWVSYLIIPFSATNEAGAWCYYSFNADADAGYIRTSLKAEVSPATSYVDVYRTREYKDSMEDEYPDMTYYWLGRFARSAGNVCPWTDNRYWPMQDWFDVHENQNADPPSSALDLQPNAHAAQYRYVQTGTGGMYFQELRLASDVDAGAWDYRSPGANCIHVHNGIAFYGGVEWPLKAPAVSFLKTGTGGKRIKIQYEYKTSEEGNIFGTPVEMQDVLYMNVENEGSAALMIYYYEGGWKLWDRLVPNDLGRFVCGRSSRPFTFDYTAPPLSSAATYTPAETGNGYVYEKNVAFMSAQNRPWEISYNQFSVPEEGEIVAITAARIAEEESLLQYHFYVATEKSLWAGEVISLDSGLPAVRLYPLSSGLGMKLEYIEDEHEDYYRPIYELTKTGVAFLGSDNRIYFLSGRYPPVTLDDTMPDLWWGSSAKYKVKDIGYAIDKDEIWVLTTGGTWVYSFDQKGWVAHRDVSYPTYTAVGPKPYSLEMWALKWYGGTYKPEGLNEFYYTDDAAIFSDASVETQPLGSARSKVSQVEADYDYYYKKISYTSTANSAVISATGTDSMIGSVIRLYDAGGAHFFSSIVVAKGIGTLTLADQVPSSVSGNAHVLLRATLTHTVDSHPKAETGMFRPRQKAYLKVYGTRHKIKISGFRELYTLNLELAR